MCVPVWWLSTIFAFKFPGRRHFEFYDVIRLPLLLVQSDRNSLCETIFCNRITSWNPRWRRPGNLKAKIGDNQILFCPTLKYYFHVFQRNFKVDCIFNNLTLICFKSGGFLEWPNLLSWHRFICSGSLAENSNWRKFLGAAWKCYLAFPVTLATYLPLRK